MAEMPTRNDPALGLPAGQWQQLKALYASPPRAYHNFGHVADVLRHYRDVQDTVGWRQPVEVWLAVLYHDAIYEAGRDDNEVRSAQLAVEQIAHWLPHRDIDAARVAQLILQTARHGQPTQSDVDEDTRLFLDCDMAILAAPAVQFDAYDRAIAEEYRGVIAEDDFRAGRHQFLRRLLELDRIYLSEHFHARCDAPARANLQRALAMPG